MHKLLIICGPTATGKTDLAIQLAKKFKGELINADSRQVYKGLDIITGKDIPKNSKLKIHPPAGGSKFKITNKIFDVGFREKKGIPIWLMDVVPTSYFFNVGEYQIIAQKVIENIWLRGKLPIVVGGTGLFIKSLIEPFNLIHIPPDKVLRKNLQTFTVPQLIEKLQEVDSQRLKKMNQSDRKNSRRLIRAIEVASYQSNTSSTPGVKEVHIPGIDVFDSLIIGLKALQEVLNQRIDERVKTRIAQGAVDEAKSLLDHYDNNNLPTFTSIGLKQLIGGIQKKDSLERAIHTWKTAEHQYAKRQMTWFKKEPNIHWFSIEDNQYKDKIENMVEAWYT